MSASASRMMRPLSSNKIQITPSNKTRTPIKGSRISVTNAPASRNDASRLGVEASGY